MPTNDRATYAVISTTGVILRIGNCSQSDLQLQAGDGETLVQGPLSDVSDDTHYWNGSEFLELPPSPGDWAEWNGTEWIDPRTPEDMAALLQSRREAASLPRTDAVLAAVNAGIIPAAEAGDAARGKVPPSLALAFSALPPEMQVEAEVRWAGSIAIKRLDPILAALAQAQGITEAQLDEMFGIVPE